ncbi:hypothetical protein ACNKHM_27600 [Shigella sonnei]
MNIVVLTAAFSSLNSGLYCTGLFCARWRWAVPTPSFMAKMSRQHVPYAGIWRHWLCMSSAYSSTIWCRHAYLRLC